MKPRIAIDMDDVLADTVGKFIAIYRRDFDTTALPTVFRDNSFHELLEKDVYKRLTDYVHEPGFFADILVMPGAIEVTQALSEKYDLFVTSAAMEFRNSLSEKYDWLDQHFPHIHWKNRVFCGDKSILRADIMIDDMPYNLVSFQGKGLLFDAPHNRDNTIFQRVLSWDEVAKELL
ncbi:5' nucleotidase, NT5C type [Larkinella punicea]|uniref:5'(3')-deoxyribonucleotidase n=1 Tax=Larkinella punicea TaxID=2315727 RepID=A0A368JPJ4_9BACT|nr:5'(3')-deoxyribonucleotidase [Larkinella punicea]RCR68916.1 5'(3')-deoxyribonucleotidase [Larkinella punicea]